MVLRKLRQQYHKRICQEVFRIRKDKKKNIEYPNSADSGNPSSISIAWGIHERLGCKKNYKVLSGQAAGGHFEVITRDFLENSFGQLNHLRPGKWIYSTTETTISKFSQYKHLADLGKIIKEIKELSLILGMDYLVNPDIIVARYPVEDKEINLKEKIIETKDIANLTTLRERNYEKSYPILHASVVSHK